LRRRTQIGDATSRARASAFRPRNITIDIAGACMPSLYEAISSLTEYYQNVCSTVRIECMSMDEQSALQAVVDGSHEFGITNKHASDEELVSTVAGLSLVDCETCGRTWRAKEVWFTCDRCHHHTLARYNTAVLVAQYTLEQLINHYQHSKEKGEQAK
jgi:hypothetical protein